MYDARLIKKSRLSMNLSKQEVLDALLMKYNFRISRPTYNSWEDGRVAPSADDLEIIAKLFGVKIEKFFIDK